jgi:hypothetical protein
MEIMNEISEVLLCSTIRLRYSLVAWHSFLALMKGSWLNNVVTYLRISPNANTRQFVKRHRNGLSKPMEDVSLHEAVLFALSCLPTRSDTHMPI